MSAKQCNKCGRFKGAGTHVCATVKKKPAVIAPSAASSVGAPATTLPVKVSSPTRPDAKKVAAILQDAVKLNNTIKALEIAISSKNANSDLRIKLEATFGKIDWNA